MGGVERHVEAAAFVGEEALVDAYSSLAEHGDATARHLWVGVAGGDYDTTEATFDEHLGAWRRFAVVAARHEGDVNGALGEEMPVGVGDRCHGIDFGMGATETAVPAFAYYTAVGGGDYCADHGVGRCVAAAGGGELQGAAHHEYVEIGKCHRSEYAGLKVSP